MTLDTAQALELLNLPPEADATAIEQACAQKTAQIKGQLAQAATPALAGKYQQMLEQLEQAQTLLLAGAAAQGDNSAKQSGTNQSSTNKSGLSQSMFDDLPSADPRNSRFGDDGKVLMQIEPGSQLAGRYRIDEFIAAGGMGAVYRATDGNTGESIAIKVMLPALLNNPRAKERFMDEARISQKLSHPNIVNVFDVQQDGDCFFLTMELLEGQDLRQLMDNRKLARQPFSLDEVRDIIASISQGLAYAHEFTIHRDIKPENIWVSETGQYKVMDFGIASVQSSSQRTQSGAVLGTAYYMAPEQLKGLKDIDGRADQYALAVLAYEMLSGEVPAGMIEPIKALRKDIPKGTANAIHQALAPKPENRFADILSFSQALQKGVRGNPGFELKLPLKPIGLAAAVLLGVLGLGSLLLSSGSTDESQGEEGSNPLVQLWNKLRPLSQAEIAEQKSNIAKLQGEIKTYQRRLDNARRELASEVRDAERNQDKNRQALQYWQQVTEDGIFNSQTYTDLEGELSKGEILLRENSFAPAKATLSQARDGYQQLWLAFQTAEQLYPLKATLDDYKRKQQEQDMKGLNYPADQLNKARQEEQDANTAQLDRDYSTANRLRTQASASIQAMLAELINTQAAMNGANKAEQAWLKRKKAYKVTAQAQEEAAKAAKAQARQLGQQGQLSAALEHWQLSQSHWDSAYQATDKTVAAIKQEQKEQNRIAAAKAAKRRLARYVTGKLLSIPGGRFQMGSNNGASDEKPVHSVRIKGFKMQAYEVSWNQWMPCVKAGQCREPDDEGWGRGKRPVINVSWNDVQSYIKWLNRVTGKRFRLPSEAEWEYAARAGSTSKYSWGNSIGHNRANCDGCGSSWDNSKTAPVGSFSPNRFGLYDMHGNVWEWVQDCWNKNYQGAPADGRAWQSGDCGRRVLRGGSWNFNPYGLRSAHRLNLSVGSRIRINGFRLVQDK